MGITAERFNEGMTYEQWKAQMTRNQDRFAANEQGLELTSADIAAFKDLPQPLNVLVLAEDWCGDVINNLPVLGRLAEASGKLNLRIFLRDQNLDLMDQYLKEGQFRSIPVFVFFDQQFNELGHFIERPDSVTARQKQIRDEIFAQHPEFGSPDTPIAQMPEDVRTQYMQATSTQRDATKAQDNREVVQELRAMVTKG